MNALIGKGKSSGHACEGVLREGVVGACDCPESQQMIRKQMSMTRPNTIFNLTPQRPHDYI